MSELIHTSSLGVINSDTSILQWARVIGRRKRGSQSHEGNGYKEMNTSHH